MATINDLRQSLGEAAEGLSDEQLLQAYAEGNEISLSEAAGRLQFDIQNRGMWGNTWSGSVDDYQAGLYGLGEAVSGALGAEGMEAWLRDRRRDNEIAAQLAHERAARQGMVTDFRDIEGVGDFGRYVGGLGIQSAPVIGEIAAGALTGGAALGPTLGRSAARVAGGWAASTPSMTAEALQSQRDQAGTTDLTTAIPLGFGAAGLNTGFGIGGLVARGRLPRNAIQALDEISGARGVAARTGATMARQAGVESVTETGQEGLFQLGRMAVDPNERFLSPEAQERYAQSAVGGAALGGVLGGAAGGWRRSQGYEPPLDETGDLLHGVTDMPPAGPPPAGPNFAMTGPTVLDRSGRPVPSGPAMPAEPLPTGVSPEASFGIEPGVISPAGTPVADPRPSVVPEVPSGPGLPGLPDIPGAPIQQTAPPAPEPTPINPIQQAAQQELARLQEQEARASEFGITGAAALDLFGQLENLYNAGVMSDTEFGRWVGATAARRYGEVRRVIREASRELDQMEAQDGAEGRSGSADDGRGVRRGAEPGPGGRVAGGDPASAGYGPGAGDATPGPVSGVQPVSPVRDGDGGASTVVTPEQLAQQGVAAVTAGIKLTKNQRTAMQYVLDAVNDGRVDDVVDSEGRMRYVDIARATGIKSRQAADTAISGAMGRLAKALGTTREELGQALIRRAMAAREESSGLTEATDTQLSPMGAPPSEQALVGAPDVEMTLDGENTGMGVINTVGGSQRGMSVGRGDMMPESRTEAELAAAETTARNRIEESQRGLMREIRALMPTAQWQKAMGDWDFYVESLGMERVSSEVADLDPIGMLHWYNLYTVGDTGVPPAVTIDPVARPDDANALRDLDQLRFEIELIYNDSVSRGYGTRNDAPGIGGAQEARGVDTASAPEDAGVREPGGDGAGADAGAAPHVRVQPEDAGEVQLPTGDRRVNTDDAVDVEFRESQTDAPAPSGRSESSTDTDIRFSRGALRAPIAGLTEVVTATQAAAMPEVTQRLRAMVPAASARPDAWLSTQLPGATLSRLSDAQRAAVLGAIHNLRQLPMGRLLMPVLRSVNAIVTYSGTLNGRSVAGAFNPHTGTILLHQSFYDDAVTPEGMLALMRLLAHEATHALDFDGSSEATAHHRSPVHVNITDKNQRVGRVVMELAHLYNRLPPGVPIYEPLQYAVGGFVRAIQADKPRATIAALGQHAAVEATPVLTEMYLTDQALMRTAMPESFAYIGSIWNAPNPAAARRIMRGDPDGPEFSVRIVGERGAAATTGQPGDAVPREVRADARAGSVPADRGLHRRSGGRDTDRRPQPRRDRGVAQREGSAPVIRAREANIAAGMGDGSVAIPPPPMGGQGIKGWADSLLKDKWRAAPRLLGWLSTEQIADRFKHIPELQTFARIMNTMAARASELIGRSDEIKRQWEGLALRPSNQAAASSFSKLMLESTMEQIWPNLPLSHEKNRHLGTDKTPSGNWEASEEVVARHAALHAQFKALPREFRELFDKVQADFESRYQAKRNALLKNILDSFRLTDSGLTPETIKQAAELARSKRDEFFSQHAVDKTTADSLRNLWDDIDEFKRSVPARINGPYFPLMRFGDHVVSWKSGAYLDAEAQLEALNRELQSLYRTEAYQPILDAEAELRSLLSRVKRSTSPETRARLREQIDEVKALIDELNRPINDKRAEVREQLRELDALRQSEATYGVEFYETIGQARRRAEQLQGVLGESFRVGHSIKDQYLRQLDAVTPAFVKRLENHMASALPEDSVNRVRASIRELYIQMLPERSALKSQLRRVGVSGVKDHETLRAYAASAMRDAWGISRMEQRVPMQQALDDMRFNRTDNDAKLIGQEMARRAAQNMTYEEHPGLTAAASLSYLTYLGISPAFIITNLTQPWFVSVPVIAGRHGMKAINGMGRAWREAASVMKASYKQDRRINFTVDPDEGVRIGAWTRDEASMIREMMRRGRVDITITHDLGATAEGRSQGWFGKVVGFASTPAQQSEILNRVATALVAYRLEKERRSRDADPNAEQHALDYAERMVAETHLNYSAENRARIMHPNAWQGWGRIMFQFRTYQQGMAFLLYKNMADAVRGDADARRAIGYLMGVQLASAGLTGIPLMAPGLGIAALVYAAFSEDDEDRDLREMMFQGIKSVAGERAAIAVTKGVPAAMGVDISQRIGMGDIFDPTPYVDDRAEGKDAAAAYWISLTGGAFGGLVANYLEAIKYAREGDFVRATTLSMPKVAADLVRAGSMGYNGLVDTRGNPIKGPEEFSTADLVVRAIGFTPTAQSRTYEQRSAFFQARAARDDARAKILRDFVRARRSGGDMNDVMRRVQDYNSRNRESPIRQSNLIQAYVARNRMEQSLRSGVPVRPQDRRIAEELGIL